MEYKNLYYRNVAFYLDLFDIPPDILEYALETAADDIVNHEYRKIGRPVDNFALWRRIDFDPEMITDLIPPFFPLSVLLIKGFVLLFSSAEIALLRALLIRYDPYTRKSYDTKTERKMVTASLRFQILARDNFSCKTCGAKPSTKDNSVILRIDHIIPVSKGGKTSLDNLHTLCQKCNSGKGSKVFENLIEDNLLYQPPFDAFHPYAWNTSIFVQIEKPLTKLGNLLKVIARIIFFS